MISLDTISQNINNRVDRIKKKQTGAGYWSYAFEGPIMTDCFFIVLSKTINQKDHMLNEAILNRILSLQLSDGSWKLYEDEETGNLSSTIQAYTALLLSGKLNRNEPQIKKAEAFIITNGGIKKAHFMTKIMLAVNGLYPYPAGFVFPMAYYLLPPSFPISMYHCSNYARIHLTPMLLCLNKRYSFTHTIDDSFFQSLYDDGWFLEQRFDWKSLLTHSKQMIQAPFYMQQAGESKALTYMLERIEENGTLYSYTSATFYMIYALLASNYKANDPLVLKAYEGIKRYIIFIHKNAHVQNSPSEVWDTALLMYALQQAGVSSKNEMIQKGVNYLSNKQQTKTGDWAVNAPNVEAGGFGFSDSNTFIPDNDDTSAVLRALKDTSESNGEIKKVWNKGLHFLLQMQNKDGGWGAFEKNAYSNLLSYIPVENAKDALIDDSTADLTGRVLECLGNFTSISPSNDQIKRAVTWLQNHQEKDGSWYGKWGICFIYGTWAAVTGLRAVGVGRDTQSIKKAIAWLESIQRDDGGFGESCKSAEKHSYVPLHMSTPSQTAWALLTLLTVKPPTSPSVQKAVHYLLNENQLSKKSLYYPTGLGLPGGFYNSYESYNEIFPLLALSEYKKSIEKMKSRE